MVQDPKPRVGERRAPPPSELRLRAIVENAPHVAVESFDEHGRVLYWNRAAETMFGWAAEDAVGKTLDRLTLDEDGARRFLEVLRDIARTGRVHGPVEWEFRARDGRTGTLLSSTFAVELSGGAREFIRVDVDVSERRAAERALAASEERLRTALDAARVGMWDWDMVSDRMTWSESLGPVYGLPRGAGHDTIEHFYEVVHPDDREAVASAMRSSVERDLDFDIEYRVFGPDGAMRWVADSGRVVRDASGRAVRLIGISADATARKRAEEERLALVSEIQRAQRLESLGLLAGGVAHDFNNLLLAVLGNADLLVRDVPADSPLRKRLDAIRTAARRGAELTQQMLAYSGKGRFLVERLDVSHLVEEMAHLISTLLSKKAALHLDLAPGLPTIEADPGQVRQVVMNLLTNASDALAGGAGEITVRTRALTVGDAAPPGPTPHGPIGPGDYVAIEVSDTGCGMDEATAERIFDPFFSTKFTGRGLGLAAVHGILRGHGGAVQVESEPGRGTTFRVLLPSSPHPPAAHPDAAHAPSPGAGTAPAGEGAVLVVDDDDVVREVTQMILETAGYRVVTAWDGQDGVDVFAKHAAEISSVVLDLTMPRLSGEEALREIRAIRPDVPVLLTSGYDENERIAALARSERIAFIQKPYTPDDFVARLREVCAR